MLNHPFTNIRICIVIACCRPSLAALSYSTVLTARDMLSSLDWLCRYYIPLYYDMIAQSLLRAVGRWQLFDYLQRVSCIFPHQRTLTSSTRTSTSPRSSSTSSSNARHPVVLIFDTETTGLVQHRLPHDDSSQPDLVQLAMILVDTKDWKKRARVSCLIQNAPKIGSEAQEVHGISNADCNQFGVPLPTALTLFYNLSQQADCFVAHNLMFDRKVILTAFHRSKITGFAFKGRQEMCTMEECTSILQLPGKYPGTFKWPTLEESYRHFMETDLKNAHDALADAEACFSIFRKLVETNAVQLEKQQQQQQQTNIDYELQNKDDHSVKAMNKTTPESSCSVVANDDDDDDNKEPMIVAAPGELKLSVNGHQFSISGKTYKYKDTIKSMGGKWYREEQAWVFRDCSMLEPAKKLVGVSR